MATSVTNVTKFFPSAQDGFTTTTSGSIASGASTVGLNSVAGYTNGETVVLVIDPTDVTKKQTFTGVIDTSGVQITGVVWTAGTNTTHSAGATVVDYETATAWSMVAKGLLVEHAQTGLHTLGSTATLTSSKFITGLNDTNGNELFKVTATGSAVNEFTVANAATALNPTLSATGGDTNIGMNINSKGTGLVYVNLYPPRTAALEGTFDYVASGGVWTGDAYASTKAASMTAIVCYVNARRIAIGAVTARTFTASKDTYVDVLDNADGTGTLVYTEVANNAASPALVANSLRIAIVVTGATNIAAATSINQGQETMILPIASSIPYAVTDSLGNRICNRNPLKQLLGYRQIISAFTTQSTSATQVTGLTCPVIVPTSRKVKINFFSRAATNATSDNSLYVSIWDGTVGSGTLVTEAMRSSISVNSNFAGFEAIITPTAASKTYNIGFYGDGAGTNKVLSAAATYPAYIKVELI